MHKLTTSPVSSVSNDSSDGMVKKPMTDMTVEELLHCMTDLDYHVILTTWRLAMLSEFDRLKLVMDDACDMKLNAHNQLREFDRVSPTEAGWGLCL